MDSSNTYVIKQENATSDGEPEYEVDLVTVYLFINDF